MKRVPAAEREFIRGEIAFLAGRLSRKYGLNVTEARMYLRELLGCSV